MENKVFLNTHTKMLSNTDGVAIIEGYASRNTKDRDFDVVIQYGIDLTNFNKNPILLYQHDRNQPLGKITKLQTDDKGLYVQAEVYKEVNPQGYAGVVNGVLKTFSIGFIGKDGEYNEDTDTFYFTKTELLEVSVVSIPSNQDATFDLVNSPCEDGFCLLGKKGYKPEGYVKKQIQEKEQDMTEEVIKLLQELVTTNKELLSTLSEKGGEVEEQKEVEEVVEEKQEETAEVEKQEEQVETKDFNLVEYVKELEVKESNFDSLLKASEELQTKLNKFLEENL